MAIPMLIMAGVAVASAVAGGVKANKAKKAAAALNANRPELSDSPFLRDNIRLAQSELNSGQTSAANNAYEQGMDRNISSSIGAIMQGGGSLNNISSIFDGSQQGRQRMTMLSENLRLNQIKNLTAAGGDSEVQRQQQFQFNEAAPWMDKAQAASAARQQGNQQMWNGIVSAGSTVAGGISSMQSEKKMDEYFKNNSGGSGGGGQGASMANFYAQNNAYLNQGARLLTETYNPNTHVNSPGQISPNFSSAVAQRPSTFGNPQYSGSPQIMPYGQPPQVQARNPNYQNGMLR